MTNNEIMLGKKLFARVDAVYNEHPEYKIFNRRMDRYEKFVSEMMEKYGCSRENIVKQIHRSR